LAASRTTGFSLGAAIAAFLYASALGTQGYAATPKQVAHAVHQGMFAVVVLCLGAAVLSAVRKGETKP
jgi:Na+/melibiose symporter-like transporter